MVAGSAPIQLVDRVDPDRLDDDCAAALRECLRAAELDGAYMARVEAIAAGRFDAVRLPVVHHQLRSADDGASICARLFAYRDLLSGDELDAIFDEAGRRTLERAGVLVELEGGWASALRIVPFMGLHLASDEFGMPDPVMGPGATTLELGRALPEGGRSLLDVGCGAGSLALVARARGVEEVVGVDIDARAIAYARFNAALNSIEARFEQGDLLAPVRGEHFETLVSQPPFITRPPEIEASPYLHGGAMGDELLRRLVAELPAALEPGGRALIYCEIPRLRGRDEQARLAPLLAQPPLPPVALVGERVGADLHALAYAAAAHPSLGPAYEGLARRYRAHMDALGIEGALRVLLDLRRPPSDSPEPGYRVVIPQARLRSYDAAALAQLRRAIELARRPDPALIELSVRVSPHARFIQSRPVVGEGEARIELRFEGGRSPDRELSEAAAVLLECIAETPTLREATLAYAEACGANPNELAAQVLAFVRESLIGGLLLA